MFSLTHRGPVAELTLSRPPVNAISDDWLEQFDAQLDAIEAPGDVRVLHIRSDQKTFCAGADLKQMRRDFARPDGADAMGRFVRRIHRLFDRIEALPQVVLAEIGGAALGGGFELALACDLRLAAEQAQLGLPEGRLGLIPGAGGTQRLSRLCGAGTAARIILSCETVDGATACRLGMVQWAAPRDRLAQEARVLADRIATVPAATLAAGKRCIAMARDRMGDGFAAEIEATRDLIQAVETRERVGAFLEGRAASDTATGR